MHLNYKKLIPRSLELQKYIASSRRPAGTGSHSAVS